MIAKELLEEISKKDFDRQKYFRLVTDDEKMRDFIINTMINHPKIMTYYHCFYIISDASAIKPELFNKYWDEFFQLLQHSNSYHRNFGLILLANLAVIDKSNKFLGIIDDYLKLTNDEKFMTAEVCVKSSFKIASVNPELVEKVINHLISLEKSKSYPDKQKELMIAFIIERFETIIDAYPNKTLLLDFAKRHLTSVSPKTRKIAKQFISNYGF